MTQGKFNAEPSKGFFVNMLTKDIPLDRAIMDLIDNSIDGAKSQILISTEVKEIKASDFFVEINFNNQYFEIKDNCGGFSKQAAIDYVFMLGKPINSGDQSGTDSVGRFGVGMKRGLFKIGNYFVVETKNGIDHFKVEEDVNLWLEEKGKWEFDFVDVNNADGKIDVNGTFIKVTNLNPAVQQDFSLSTFENSLKKEIRKTFNYSIKSGIKIRVNGQLLDAEPITFLKSDSLKPYYLKEIIEDVKVEIFVGIGEPNPNEAGWYIYCNDRLMVDKDTSNLTGWDGGKKFYDDSGVQKYHNKVAMFRGLVFFSSNDSSKLPMTTTKWGIDVNSTLYKTVRSKMINAMKQVLGQLNKLDNAEQRSQIVANSTLVDIKTHHSDLSLSSTFVFPEIQKSGFDDNTVQIKYRVEKELVLKTQEYLELKTYGEVGLATFQYFVKMKKINDGE